MADLPRVVIVNPVREDLSPERAVLEGTARLDAVRAEKEEDLPRRAPDAAGILLWHDLHLTVRSLSRLPRCRLIVRMGVGYDNIDVADAEKHGIGVANIPDYGSEDVADSAVGMAVALLRGVPWLNSRLRAGEGPWKSRIAAPLHRLRGLTFGIVGVGRIGTAAALRAKGFGMDVVFHDPYVPPGYEKAIGCRRAETLEALLSRSRALSLHCPLTGETRGLIDAARIAELPPGAVLVNTARGAVVDTDAVADALERGHLAGAALDVLPVEPPADDERILRAWRDPNHPAHHRLILTPHSAWYTEEGLLEMRRKAADAARRAVLGQPVPTLVNRPARR